MKPYRIFVVVQPGLENFAEREIISLGYKDLHRIKGGFFLYGHMSTIMKLNFGCRTISRVLIDIAEFEATSFSQLQKHFKNIPWQEYILNQNICIRVTSYQCKLYHEKAIADRLIASLSEIMGKSISVTKSPDDTNTQLIIVYAKHDRFIIRLDSSGSHLHKRGYGLYKESAPLRETIASAMLDSIRWQEKVFSIHDPMCGSGTIAIEAAVKAKNIPLCEFRQYAFQKWDCFDDVVFNKVRNELINGIKENINVTIKASDIDENALNAAIANAKLATVAHLIDFSHQSVFDSIFDKSTTLITNPPWGKRVHLDNTKSLYNLMTNLSKIIENVYLLIPKLSAKSHFSNYHPLLNIKSGTIPLELIRLD